MFLESASGYMMPFLADKQHDVTITLDYGEQRHPATGENFFHKGVDLVYSEQPLFAMATGVVVGVGTDAVHENYVIVKYGKYEVKYGHIKQVYVAYSDPVTAGQQIAWAGRFLHFGVMYDGEPLDPTEFFGMFYANINLLGTLLPQGEYIPMDFGVDVHTDYDDDQEEILKLMEFWWAMYMDEISRGTYTPPTRVEASLRNIFAQAGDKNYYFENIPQFSNPLGLGKRSAPLVGKVQNVIIGDFLCYMALRHNIYLNSWSEEQKKNLLSRLQPTV